MVNVTVIFQDGHKYALSLEDQQVMQLHVDVQSTKIDSSNIEDFFCLSFCTNRLVIAPMKEIKSYEIIFVAPTEEERNKILKKWIDGKE